MFSSALRAYAGKRQRRGHRGGQLELVLVLGRRARGVPHRGDPRLGGHQHVRAMMLHRLESRDGAAELLAHLGVVDGGVDAVRCSAHRLGGQQRPRPGQRRCPRAGQDVVGADAARCRGGLARSAGSGRGCPAPRPTRRRGRAPAAARPHRRRSAAARPARRPARFRRRRRRHRPRVRTRPSRPMPAVTVPSISPGSSRDFCSGVPSLAITADAITVGTNGPGATARPSSSTTTTSSGSP